MSTAPEHFSNYVDGRWLEAPEGARLDSVDPYTGKVWATVPQASDAQVAQAVAAARWAFDEGPWADSQPAERARFLRRLAALVTRDAELYARLESRDNGKLYKEVLGQWRTLPDWLEYYAGLAMAPEGEVLPSGRANFLALTHREPVGVVAAITPWNSPGLLLVWKLAPALAAGCTLVVKPSEYAPVSTAAFARLVNEAGLPPGVFNVVTGGAGTGRALVGDPGVDKIAFTGSDATGRHIAHAAADRLARCSLELGGKSAQLVFGDADLDEVVNGVLAGVFAAAGQSCMAGSRVLVQRERHDELVQALVRRTEGIRLGDPANPETDIGPIATRPQYEKILDLIELARAEGAQVAVGGKAHGSSGLFVEPTILTGVDNRARIAQEEVFGPVVVVIPFDDESEAVALANDSRYGLAAGIWTRDVRRAHRVARRLRVGTVWINAYRVVGPAVPFGGFKHSGIGRENGRAGLDEYLETKSVWIELDGATRDPFARV